MEQPPTGDGWSHETKFDGYGTQAIKDADGIRFYTETEIDWTAKYRPLAKEAAALEAESFIIECETIVTDEAGLSDFHALRSAITRRPQDLYLVAFDLLHLNGHDLRDMALKNRREIPARVHSRRRPHPVQRGAAGHRRRRPSSCVRGQSRGHRLVAPGQRLPERQHDELAQDLKVGRRMGR
ncbi:hypothetical protein [Mesorhizobium sp.]|uniref:ATP-dependent DNA ligase n=1 Tax=Mesorhizobium sp. TaxID=1871066 RepID=UPI00345D6909